MEGSNSTESYDVSPSENLVVRTGESFLEAQPSHAIPYIGMTIIALTVGSVGNLVIVGCFAISKALSKVGNEFLFNMALSDLCVTAVAEPMCILGAIQGKAYFDENPILCQVTATLCLTTCICAFLNLGAITMNRYVRICRPSLYKRLYTRKACVAMCITIWVVAFFAEAPNIIWTNSFFDVKTHQCIWQRTNNMGYTFFLGLILIAGPLLMMTAAYIVIFLRVKESKSRIGNYNTGEGGKDAKSNFMGLKETIKSCKTLFLVLTMMIVCWTPYTVVILMDFKDVLSMEIHLWVTYLAHLHSSLTIFIYGFTNPVFRAAFQQLIHCSTKELTLVDSSSGEKKTNNGSTSKKTTGTTQVNAVSASVSAQATA